MDTICGDSFIDSLQVGGGTFTQDGIHKAREILGHSDAQSKTILLLSDGVPTYTYDVKDKDNYLVDG